MAGKTRQMAICVSSHGQGLNSTSAAASITVGSSVTIQFAGGLGGGSVDDDSIYVGGTISAPPNSAVNVNGQLATVTADGQFFVNELALQPGANTITATVTTADGQTASQSITINRSATPAQFVVTVAPGGIATSASPLNVAVTIDNPSNTAFATITLQCNDPVAGSDVNQPGTYQCVYTGPGLYRVKVSVKNALGNVIYSVVKTVAVKSPEQHIGTVRSVYSNLTDRLKAGNKASALNLFFSHAQTKYNEIFTALGTNLAAAAAQLGDTAVITASEDHAEIVVIRTVGAEKKSFLVYMMRGEDGVWRIESM